MVWELGFRGFFGFFDGFCGSPGFRRGLQVCILVVFCDYVCGFGEKGLF